MSGPVTRSMKTSGERSASNSPIFNSNLEDYTESVSQDSPARAKSADPSRSPSQNSLDEFKTPSGHHDSDARNPIDDDPVTLDYINSISTNNDRMLKKNDFVFFPTLFEFSLIRTVCSNE